jgi:hypothetical protein
MSKEPIFNPFNVETTVLASQSSMINTEVGICPCCKHRMVITTIDGNENVYYCVSDRITLPLKAGESNV